jgi:hypothetical protein
MNHIQEMLEEYAGIDASEFEEHIDDSILSAKFGINSIIGVSYITSSGIEGFTDENGQFTYDIGDIISFKNAAGEVILELDSSVIGDDKLITLDELGITINDINPEIVEESDVPNVNIIETHEIEEESEEESLEQFEEEKEGESLEKAEEEIEESSEKADNSEINFDNISKIQEELNETDDKEDTTSGTLGDILETPATIPGLESDTNEISKISSGNSNLEPTDGNNGYGISSYSDDSNVQIKVEETISDGVTN